MPLVYAYCRLASDHFLQGDMDTNITMLWIQKLVKMTKACKISNENTTYKEVHRLKTVGKISQNI
jgi:hypothetical protein